MPKLYAKPEDGGCLPLSVGRTDIEHSSAPDSCEAEFVYKNGMCQKWQAAVFENHRCVFYRETSKYVEVVNRKSQLDEMGVESVVLSNTYHIDSQSDEEQA